MNRSPFVVRKVVRFAHCDPAGIIYYPQYFMLAHDCKEDWFRDGLGYPFQQMITADRRGFPIVKLDAEFARASRMGDDLDFEITVRAIGATSLKLDYRCVCGTEERMRIKTVLVMTALDSGAAVAIPDWLRARLAAFQEQPKDAA
jgi:4-hydroxybenzoyl-CoA thioesterase